MAVNFEVVGAKIQQIRKYQRKTQEDMAEALNVSISYISQMERGVTKISLDTLQRVADYLDCTLIALLEDVISSDEEDSLKKKLNDPVYCYMKSLIKEDLNEYNYRELMLKLFQNCTKSDQRMVCYLLATYLIHK